ncbi:MAG: tetratricopeptide repeat protein [Brumimicrobium sp.]|nr:tetratricopeptide repeat protein [Brumimicrobium sp.]
MDNAKYFIFEKQIVDLNRYTELKKLLSILIICSSLSPGVTQENITVDSMITLGNRKIELSRISEAADLFIRARRVSDKTKNDKDYFKASVNLANLYTLYSRTPEAEKIFSKIQPKEIYGAELNCQYYHRKAFFFNQTGLLDSAIIYSQKSLEIANKHNLKSAKGTVLNELSNIYLRKGEYDKAVKFAHSSCDLYKNQPRYYANAYFNKAVVYHKMENFDSSIAMLKDNLKNIEETQWHSVKGPIYFYLADAYFKLNDSLKGFKYLSLERLENIKKQKEEHIKSFNNLMIEYETEQKNLEIAQNKNLINRQVYEQKRLTVFVVSLTVLLILAIVFTLTLRRKNRKLRDLIEENEFLVGEANHRIKNNLQLINSLIADEMEKKGAKEDDHMIQVASKIETITTLHQQLYLNDDKSLIDLSNYLKILLNNLSHLLTPNEIVLNKDFKVVHYHADRSVYIGLVLNELVINSIKHAFLKNQNYKEINVSLKELGNVIILTFRDNGVGFNPDYKPHLVDLLTKQLRAKVTLENKNGFNFKMEIKTTR